MTNDLTIKTNKAALNRPERVVIVKPCCIGDVIFATALLGAVRRAYPAATIDWAVSSGLLALLRGHPALHSVIDTGPRANPAGTVRGIFRLAGQLRRGRYDLAIVPERSRLMALAVLLSGIPRRAGLNSGGRGLTYTIRAPVDPAQPRHEAEIYLDIARAMHIDTAGCYVGMPPAPENAARADALLRQHGIDAGTPFTMVHPGGGVNAGMVMVEKRWPPAHFAALAQRLSQKHTAKVILIGAASDRPALDGFRAAVGDFPGMVGMIDLSERAEMTLAVTGAMAARAMVYVGNDNGVGHLAAASGGRVLMIFGPSDPRRYAPFVPPDRGRAVWRPFAAEGGPELPIGGVSGGVPQGFTWEKHGPTVDDAWIAVQELLP